MFNPLCVICSELLKNDDIVSTSCGHVFHRDCLEPWLASSRTCPTCRHPTTTTTLIKLFFIFDDQKANLQLDDILKTNDDLTKIKKELKDKLLKFEIELRDTQTKLKDALADVARLERQKQLDEMTIAGITGIKNESTKEIVKLNEALNTLKLDLLAEKQLRRMHQMSLHELKPEDDTYNPRSIKLDSLPDSSIFGHNSSHDFSSQIPEFSKITVTPEQVKEKDTKPYVIPSKIQKSNENPLKSSRLGHSKYHKSLWKTNEDKPAAYKFQSPTTPSTSGYLMAKNQKRSFGEGLVFTPPITTVPASTPSTTGSSFFSFSMDSPTFPLVSSSSSSNLPNISLSSPLRNYRESQNTSPTPTSSNGPKISDR